MDYTQDDDVTMLPKATPSKWKKTADTCDLEFTPEPKQEDCTYDASEPEEVDFIPDYNRLRALVDAAWFMSFTQKSECEEMETPESSPGKVPHLKK